jgi:hypothetical protein
MDKKYQLVFKWHLIKFEIWILFHKSKMSKTRLNTLEREGTSGAGSRKAVSVLPRRSRVGGKNILKRH